MRVHVKGAILERLIEEECEEWAREFPQSFKNYKIAMAEARSNTKSGTIGRVELEIPNRLFDRLSIRLGTPGVPNMQWNRDPETAKAFKSVFLIGCLRPGRGV